MFALTEPVGCRQPIPASWQNLFDARDGAFRVFEFRRISKRVLEGEAPSEPSLGLAGRGSPSNWEILLLCAGLQTAHSGRPHRGVSSRALSAGGQETATEGLRGETDTQRALSRGGRRDA